MKKLLLLVFLSLLLRTPGASPAFAFDANSSAQGFPGTSVDEAPPFTDSEEDIFSTNYERELLSRRVFKKSLPPQSRKEIISWAFRTAKSNTLL